MSTVQPLIHSNIGGSRGLLPDSAMSEAKMARLASMLNRLAPKPGALVYVDSSKLPFPIADMEPTVFSAFDACTHLQVGRVYLTDTFASAADFLEFISRKLPFSISRIRTMAKEPFWVEPSASAIQRFSGRLEAQGILHTVIADRTQDDLFSLFDHLTFVHQAGNAQRRPVVHELIGELITFLYFHNNNRTLATLKGQTPLEKLNSVSGLEVMPSFDPFTIEPKGNESRRQPATPPPTIIERISA